MDDAQPMGRVAYLMRWMQPGLGPQENTGDLLYGSLNEALDVCRRTNDFWRGHIIQRPVEVVVRPKGAKAAKWAEARDLRHLVGYRSPRRKRRRGQGVRTAA